MDAVHRLIEVFLQYKQREACSNCLSLLFNYQCKLLSTIFINLSLIQILFFINFTDNRKDLRACAEIIKSCSELEMPLNEVQNEQFLSLFLNQNDSSNVNDSNSGPITRKPAQHKEFQYKF